MSDLKTDSDLYIVIINNTKTIAQHLEENKWRICGSMVNYENTDVDVIKSLNLANEPNTSEETALNIDFVSESWYSKLKCLMEGLEINNIDLLLATGKDGDYRRLGELMQKRIKELM